MVPPRYGGAESEAERERKITAGDFDSVFSCECPPSDPVDYLFKNKIRY